MRSAFTGKEYESIRFVRVDSYRQVLYTDKGAVFQELEDSTWLLVDEAGRKDVRYTGSVHHNGGIAMHPIYERVDDIWYNMVTGRPGPNALPKQRQ
jgi:hypothetical protein